ncbi:SWI/SNF chromatin-remodeling complex subunit [Saitoella coloradoensis]
MGVPPGGLQGRGQGLPPGARPEQLPPKPPPPPLQLPENLPPTTKNLHLAQYVYREELHQKALDDQQTRINALIMEKRAESDRNAVKVSQGWNVGYNGYGNGAQGRQPVFMMPENRKRPRPRMKELKIPKKVMRELAKQPEVLVPVRVDLESDKYKLRDTFTWNLNERNVPSELFAENMCQDYGVPPYPIFAPGITNAIAEAIADYHPHVFSSHAPKASGQSASTLPYAAYKDDDMRITIKLDITVGMHNLIDQFEWDLNDPDASPEEFAGRMCSDMALSAEFETAIAHAVREQCQIYTKSLFLVGHSFDGRGVEDEDLKGGLLPTLRTAVRTVPGPGGHVGGGNVGVEEQMGKWGPVLYELSDGEMDRQEKDRERESRRKRRQTRGRRGIVLPDREDIPKTMRTAVQSSVLPGGAGVLGARFGSEKVGGGLDEDRIIDDMIEEGEGETIEYTAPARGGRDRRGGVGAAVPEVERERERATPRRAAVERKRYRIVESDEEEMYEEEVIEKEESPVPSLLITLKVPGLRDWLDRRRQGGIFGGVAGPPGPSALAPTSDSVSTSAQDQESSIASSSTPQAQPPSWLLTTAIPDLLAKYPNDRFEPAWSKRDPPGWRIKCFDCQGMIYQLGPGESLMNFETHLRNRGHRDKVEQRLVRDGLL